MDADDDEEGPPLPPGTKNYMTPAGHARLREELHALWVLEADAIGKGPIAKVALPFRLRQQVHGWWVPQAALDAAK